MVDQGSLRLSAEAGERGADIQILIRFETRTPRTNMGSEPENEGGEDEKSRAEIAVNLRLDGPTREDPNPCQRAQNMIGVTGK